MASEMDVENRFLNGVVLPGDTIGIQYTNCETLLLGEGLLYKNNQIVSTKFGIFRVLKEKNFFYVGQSRISEGFFYFPKVGDEVLGTVEGLSFGFYVLNLSFGIEGLLHPLSFRGANKRKKPSLEVGDIVYCKIVSLNRFHKVECSCLSEKTTTTSCENFGGEFGRLQHGLLFSISFGEYKSLKFDKERKLDIIGRSFPFEIIVGRNLRVWIDSKEKVGRNQKMITIRNLIQKFDVIEKKRLLEDLVVLNYRLL